VPGETYINVAKHRNGQTDMIKVKAELQYQKFVDMPQGEGFSVNAGPDQDRQGAKPNAGLKGSYEEPSLDVHKSFTISSKGNNFEDDDFGSDSNSDDTENPFV
jgi:replicative DNA helicase